MAPRSFAREDDVRLAWPDEASVGAVAAHVVQLCARRGLSFESLASRIGVTSEALTTLLEAQEALPMDLLWKLATELQVPFGTLLRAPPRR